MTGHRYCEGVYRQDVMRWINTGRMWFTWAMVIVLCISASIAQDDFGGGDDAGGADMDLESMMGGDSAGGNNKNTAQVNPVKEKSFSEESILALKQLGVIIGEYLVNA